MERMGLEEDVPIESRIVSQDHRERPEPRRGLQLRHPQARRRVRRRHQQAARDDLRRARQGPPQRGPRARPIVGFLDEEIDALLDQFAGGDTDGRLEPRGPVGGAAGDGPRGRRHHRGRALGRRRPRGAQRARPRPRRRGARREGAGGRRGRLGDGRAARAAADDRFAVGRAPHRARRHAPRASASAGMPSRTRSTSSGRKRSPLYTELRDLIRHQVATTIFRVKVTREPAPPPASRCRWLRRSRRARCAALRRPPPVRATAAQRPRRWRPGSGRYGPAAARPAGTRRGGRRERHHRCTRPAGGAERPGRARIARRPTVVGGGPARIARRAPARVHADRARNRPERPVLVRLGPEVQEVPRSLRRRSPELAVDIRDPRRSAVVGSLVSGLRRPSASRCSRAMRGTGSATRAIAMTNACRRAPSLSSAPPSTTADRRRSSRHGSITPWTCSCRPCRYLVVTGGKARRPHDGSGRRPGVRPRARRPRRPHPRRGPPAARRSSRCAVGTILRRRGIA